MIADKLISLSCLPLIMTINYNAAPPSISTSTTNLIRDQINEAVNGIPNTTRRPSCRNHSPTPQWGRRKGGTDATIPNPTQDQPLATPDNQNHDIKAKKKTSISRPSILLITPKLLLQHLALCDAALNPRERSRFPMFG